MAIVINGSGTVTGLAVGGLPDGTVDSGTLATDSVDSAELIDGAVDDSHMAAMAASKLTGALPAISGASLTGLAAGSAGFAARFTNAAWASGNDLDILPFDSDSSYDNFDTDSCYNTSTYKFTAPATGVYLFWSSIYTANSDPHNGFAFLKNSSKLRFQQDPTAFTGYVTHETGDHIMTATVVTPLASGDTIAVCSATSSDWYTGHSQWGGCRLA